MKNYKQSCYKCKQYLDQVDSIIISRDTKNLDSLIFGHKCRIEYGAARSSVLGYLIDKDKLLNSLRIQTEDDQFKRIRISDIKSFEYIERDGYLKRKREADSILTIVNKESSSGNYNSAINVLEANKSKMERMGVDYILKYYSNLAQSNISTDDKESFLKITDNIGKYDRNLSYYWQLKY